MRNLYIALLLLAVCPAIAQNRQETELDLLRAPSSPAAQLLNISPNAIERPTDLSSLWISVNASTENLNRFPTDYALDLSPASLFNSRSITLKDMQSTRTSQVLWQTLVLSTGIRAVEDSATGESFYKAAIGMKVSFIRAPWTKATHQQYQALSLLQEKITDQTSQALDEVMEDSIYLAKRRSVDSTRPGTPEREMAEQELADLLKALLVIRRAQSPALYDQLKALAREFRIERKGGFLDLAGGFAARFPDNRIGYSLADRSGLWLNGGYEGGNNNLSILGLARYLYQPESIFADPTGTIPTRHISTFDAGARVVYTAKDDRFNFSFESIYRSVLNESVIDPSWRLIFSAEMDTGFNTRLSFSFGRDFDGTISKGGNLVAALNFIAGFGSRRAL